MIIAMDTSETLTLIRVASKAAEFSVELTAALAASHPVDSDQFGFDLHQVKTVLANLDRAYPGVVPVPHDGKTWAERDPLE